MQTEIDMIGAVSSAVINRINFPRVVAKNMTRGESLRAKTRPLLSMEDEEDARQTVALVLIQSGALERGTMNFNTWKHCFRTVRQLLRMNSIGNRTHELPYADLPETCSPLEHPYDIDATRQRIARKARYWRACIGVSFALDDSRKRLSARNGALKFLRFLVSNATGHGIARIDVFRQDTKEARSKRAKRFADYVERGEIELTRRALEGVSAISPKFLGNVANAFALAGM